MKVFLYQTVANVGPGKDERWAWQGRTLGQVGESITLARANGDVARANGDVARANDGVARANDGVARANI